MTDLIQTLNSLGDTWAVHLFHATWQSTLVAVILLAIVALGRRLPSPLRYGLLLIALLKFAVPPMLSLPTGLFAWAPPPQAVAVYTPAVSIPDARPPMQPATFTPPSTGIEDRTPTGSGGTQPETTATGIVSVESSSSLTWNAQLMVVHILGSLCCLLFIGFQVLRFRRSLRGAQEVREGDIYTIHQDLCEQFKFRRIPRLLITEEETSPAAFGLFRRTILLSESTVRKQSTDSIRMILAHELAHLKRWDLWINWLQLLLFTLWWFNPVYWYLSKKIRQSREDCCDDTLLSLDIGTGETYCDTLISAAEDLNHRTPIGATLGFAEKLHPLGRRMKRIMDPGLKRYRRLTFSGLAIVVLMGVVFLPGLRPEVEGSEERSDQLTERVLDVLSDSAPLVKLKILNEAGEPIERACVTCDAVSGFSPKSPHRDVFTGKDGIAELSGFEPVEKPCLLTVVKDGFAPASVVVEIGKLESPFERTIHLQEGIEVPGKAICSDGLPATGWSIMAYPKWWNSGRLPDRAEVAEDGTFSLQHIIPGEYNLHVYIPQGDGGGTSFQISTSELPPSEGPLIVKVPKPSPKSLVSLQGIVEYSGDGDLRNLEIAAIHQAGGYAANSWIF
ncbi:MAG: M48 family metalloprotease, partial [Candidatus Omnitrophica bacterium]|nr:M48 family metalloprotease [Candidatus Omnitrophota bacterium]